MRKVNMLKIFTLMLTFSFITVLASCTENTVEEPMEKVTEESVDEAAENVTEEASESVPTSSTSPQSPMVLDYFIKVDGDRPYAIAFDNVESMYMVTAPSSGSGTLSKVSADGTVKNLATLEGSFIGPGIDVDGEGNVYITVGNQLLKATPEGEISVVAEGFSRCFDVKITSDNSLFVADDFADTIYLVSPSGEKSVYYKGKKNESFILTSLLFDKNNNCLYAIEDNCLLSFDTSQNTKDTKPVLVADKLDMFYLCFDSQNNIYMSSAYTGKIQKLDKNGAATSINTSPLATPTGLATGGKGFDKDNLYVCVEDGIVKIPIID